jgi:hypothetical protein
MTERVRARYPLAGFVVALKGTVIGGCATVAPRLPAAPSVTSRASLRVGLAGSIVDTPLVTEVAVLLHPLGSVEQRTVAPGDDLNGLCSAGFDLVVRADSRSSLFCARSSVPDGQRPRRERGRLARQARIQVSCLSGSSGCGIRGRSPSPSTRKSGAAYWTASGNHSKGYSVKGGVG